MDDSLFKELFLELLPMNIQVVLTSLYDILSLELATRVECMMEAYSVSRSVSEVASSPETFEHEINWLQAAMVNLYKMLWKFASAKKPVNRGHNNDTLAFRRLGQSPLLVPFLLW